MLLSTEVIIQLFQWNWDSVANECRDFIGPAGKSAKSNFVSVPPAVQCYSKFRLSLLIRSIGYGYVQVNPVTEHIQGSQWWTDYQVVSYKLQSKRGSREQYQNMVNTCHAAGVKVIAGICMSPFITPTLW